MTGLKPISIFFLLLFIIPNICSLTLETDNATFQKGEIFRIFGRCTSLDTVKVSSFQDIKEIFEESAECSENGTFSLTHQISYLDPEGDWLIFAAEGDENKTNTIRITPTKESSFLVITFLSPSTISHYKNEDLDISVKITDAGQPVEDANVLFWGAEGEKQNLVYKGSGIYSSQYTIPLDTPAEAWDLRVTSLKKAGAQEHGGETKINMEIGSAPLQIDIIWPKAKSIEIRNQATIEAKITYFNGKQFDGNAAVEIAGKKFNLERKSEYLYGTTLFISEEYLGTNEFAISAEDKFGNFGKKEVEFVVIGGIISQLQNAGVYILVAVIIAAVFIFLAYPRISKNLNLKKLTAEERKLNFLIEKLQRDYFETNVIDRQTYQKKLAEFEAKLNEAKKKLNKT